MLLAKYTTLLALSSSSWSANGYSMASSDISQAQDIWQLITGNAHIHNVQAVFKSAIK